MTPSSFSKRPKAKEPKEQPLVQAEETASDILQPMSEEEFFEALDLDGKATLPKAKAPLPPPPALPKMQEKKQVPLPPPQALPGSPLPPEEKPGFFSVLFGKKQAEGIKEKNKELDQIKEKIRSQDLKVNVPPPAETFSEDIKEKTRIEQEKKLLDEIKERNMKEYSLKKDQIKHLEEEVQNLGKDVVSKKQKLSKEIEQIRATKKAVDDLQKSMEKRDQALTAKEGQYQTRLAELQTNEASLKEQKESLEAMYNEFLEKQKQFEEEVGLVLKKKELEAAVADLDKKVEVLKKQELEMTTKIEVLFKTQLQQLLTLAGQFIQAGQFERAKAVYELINYLFSSVHLSPKDSHELKLVIQQLYNTINLGIIGK